MDGGDRRRAQRRDRLYIGLADRGDHQHCVLPAILLRVSIPRSSSSRLLCNSCAGGRRTGDRFDGALRLGKDSRPRYSGSARSDSFWSQPHGAENRRAQAFVVGDLHRHRRPLRRRRSDHHDGRGGGLDLRAIFSPLFRGTKNAARRRRRRRHGRYLRLPRRRRAIGNRAFAL